MSLSKLVTAVLVGAGLVVGCSGAERVEGTYAAREAPLLADHHRCELGRIETLPAACAAAHGPSFAYVNAGPDGPHAPLVNPDRFVNVRLPADGAQHRGFILFLPPRSGEWVFYLGTPNVPFSIRRADTLASTPVVCSRYVSDSLANDLTGSTCRLKGAYVADVDAGKPYWLEFGPSPASASSITFYAAQARPAGARIDSGRACVDTELAPLNDACPIASSTTAINAATFGSTAPPAIDAGVAYGVHLANVGGEYEGGLDFVPPYTDMYLVSLGSPAIEVRTSVDGQTLPLTCGGFLSAEMKTRLTGGACDPIRGAFRLLLRGGEPARLELGRNPSSHWVRLSITASSPDSDGDGVSDALDSCPTGNTGTPHLDIDAWVGGGYDGAVGSHGPFVESGQTFVANSSGRLDSVAFNAARHPSTTNVEVSVREFDTASLAPTTLVASRVFDVSSISTSLFAPDEFRFELCGGQIVAGRTYIASVRRIDGAAFYVHSNLNSYANGFVWLSQATSSTTEPTWDTDFRVWISSP